jgi:hypothetical protein
MAKALKTAAEIAALVNAELSKHDVCKGTRVTGITPVADGARPSINSYSSAANSLNRSGGGNLAPQRLLKTRPQYPA